jgi:HEAT repeat protein
LFGEHELSDINDYFTFRVVLKRMEDAAAAKDVIDKIFKAQGGNQVGNAELKSRFSGHPYDAVHLLYQDALRRPYEFIILPTIFDHRAERVGTGAHWIFIAQKYDFLKNQLFVPDKVELVGNIFSDFALLYHSLEEYAYPSVLLYNPSKRVSVGSLLPVRVRLNAMAADTMALAEVDMLKEDYSGRVRFYTLKSHFPQEIVPSPVLDFLNFEIDFDQNKDGHYRRVVTSDILMFEQGHKITPGSQKDKLIRAGYQMPRTLLKLHLAQNPRQAAALSLRGKFIFEIMVLIVAGVVKEFEVRQVLAKHQIAGKLLISLANAQDAVINEIREAVRCGDRKCNLPLHDFNAQILPFLLELSGLRNAEELYQWIALISADKNCELMLNEKASFMNLFLNETVRQLFCRDWLAVVLDIDDTIKPKGKIVMPLDIWEALNVLIMSFPLFSITARAPLNPDGFAPYEFWLQYMEPSLREDIYIITSKSVNLVGLDRVGIKLYSNEFPEEFKKLITAMALRRLSNFPGIRIVQNERGVTLAVPIEQEGSLQEIERQLNEGIAEIASQIKDLPAVQVGPAFIDRIFRECLLDVQPAGMRKSLALRWVAEIMQLQYGCSHLSLDEIIERLVILDDSDKDLISVGFNVGKDPGLGGNFIGYFERGSLLVLMLIGLRGKYSDSSINNFGGVEMPDPDESMQPSHLINILETRFFDNRPSWPLRIILSAFVVPHEFGNLLQSKLTGMPVSVNLSLKDLFAGIHYQSRAPPCWGGILVNFVIFFFGVFLLSSQAIPFVSASISIIGIGNLIHGLIDLYFNIKKILSNNPIRIFNSSFSRFCSNLMYLWFIVAIIGGSGFGNFSLINSNQAIERDLSQEVRVLISSNEEAGIWDRASVLYQQIKLDPDSVLEMEISEKDLEFLLKEFKTKEGQLPESWVRQFCIFLLGQKDNQQSEEILRAALSDTDNDVRTMAVISLTIDNDRQAISLLKNSRFTQGGSVQQQSILSLYGLGLPEATNFLLQSLEDNLHPDIRYAAISALAGRADQIEVREAFIDLLKSDPEPMVRKQAALNLAGIDNLQVKDALVSAFSDSNLSVKEAAILSIAPQADLKIIELIKPCLLDPHASVRQAAVESLFFRLDDFPQSLDLLVPKLADPDLSVRSTVVSVLGPSIDRFPQLKQPFINIANDTYQPVEIRQAAMFSLSRIDSPETKVLLVDNLANADWQIRQSAVLGLGNLGDPKDIELIKPLAKDPSWQVRQAVVSALAYNINQPQIGDLFKDLLKFDPEPLVRKQVAYSLVGIDNSLRRNVYLAQAALIDPDQQVRQAAILTLGTRLDSVYSHKSYLVMQLGSLDLQTRLIAVSVLGSNIDKIPSITSSFLFLAKDHLQPVEIRQNAMFYLSRIDTPEIKALLVSNLGNSDWGMRQSAVLGLSNFKDQEVPGLLKPLTQDPVWQVRQATAISLGNFYQPKTFDYLKPLINDDNWQVRLAAVQAVGTFEIPQVSDLLIPKLQDPSSILRQAAVESLGVRVHEEHQIIEPLVDVLKYDSDAVVRQLAAFSLITVPSPRLASVESLIQQNVPDVVVVIPGVDDGLGFAFYTQRSSTLDESIWSNWRLRSILEAGGVKVIEHHWEGNLLVRSFRDAQLSLDDTIDQALNLSQTGRIGIIPYSGGNYVAERLFEPTLSPTIKEALAANRIHIISLGNPSFKDFGLLDSNWVNVWSLTDPISMLSVMPWPKEHDISTPKLSHFAYNNQTTISRVGYYMFGWKYTPYSGSWSSSYNFSSFAPPGI